MIPEAPFLFSIAALSASLAGLAGLVVGLRRGSDMRPIDLFRLREMVEFSFANILFTISIVPLTLILGSTALAVRLAAAVVLVYAVATAGLLARTSRRLGIDWTRAWSVGAVVINVLMLGIAAATIVAGEIGLYEALLVILLARPMFAFLLVMASFGES